MRANGRSTLFRCLAVSVLSSSLILSLTTAAQAGILDARWTAPTTNVDGTPLTDLASYRVYYSTSSTPCPGSSFFSVASPTQSPGPSETVSFRLTGLSTGTPYYVSVTAVDTGGNESACLAPAQSATPRLEFAVTPSQTIQFGTVSIGSFDEQTVTVQNTEGGTVTGTVTTSAPFSVVSGASFTLTGVGATHTVQVRFTPTVAADVTGNLSFTAGGSSVTRMLRGTGVADPTAPTISITAPTAAATFSTTSASLNLAGTAADNVAVTEVTWSNSRGGNGTASGTTAWSASGVHLQSGANVITVTARDAANNTGTATLTVTLSDTTSPTITITAPTAAASFSTTSTAINLAGTASDDIAVTQVSWSNDRGTSGTATGTTSWSANGVAVQTGVNVLTVTARDAANNSSTATLTVTVTDATPPSLTLTAPSPGVTVTGTAAITATASDNLGVVGVQFRVDGVNLGPEDTSSPYTASWNTTTTPNGNHTLSAIARDAAGNSTTSAPVTVNVSNVAPPVISGVGAAGITSTAATITWTTDTLSNTQVEYGLTTAYGLSSGVVTTLVTSHSQTLSGLAANTTYQFRVRSRDASGNLSTSGNFTFTTLPSPTTGLVAHWTFNETTGATAADSSGNGNTATLSGATWTAGVIGGAVALNGLADFVSASHTSGFNAYPLTIAGWVKTSATTGNHGIVNKYVHGSANGYRLFVSSGRLCAEYFRDATRFVSDGTGCPLAVAGVADGQWHHVVLTVDALGARLYVDAAQRTSVSWTGTPGAPTTTQQITVGDDGGSGGFFGGTIDDVRIYARALSPTEVAGLYSSIGGNQPGAPVISAVAVPSIEPTRATITWATSTASDSEVEYGTTTAYGTFTPRGTALVTSHSASLGGLTPGTVHHFRVRSRDAGGNLAVSSDSTFRTPDMPRTTRSKRGKNKNWFDSFLDWLLD